MGMAEHDRDWLFTLANRWQFAAGLQQCAGPAEIKTALEMLLELPAHTDCGVERMLMRGFLLEVAAGIRAACRNLPARDRAQLIELSDQLSGASQLDLPLRNRIAAALADLQHRPLLEGAHLAYRARAWLDAHAPSLVTLAKLARELETNTGDLWGSFKREFGITIATYQRQQRAEAVVAALAAGAAVKQIATDSACGEATVRRLVRATTGCTPRQLGRRYASNPVTLRIHSDEIQPVAIAESSVYQLTRSQADPRFGNRSARRKNAAPAREWAAGLPLDRLIPSI
jgi:methylphosphotriester-DNA--protein-cysteine methyltransferase